MRTATIRSLQELSQALKEDPRVKKLEAAELAMSQSPEVMALAKKKDEAAEAYAASVALLGPDAPSSRKAQTALYEALKALESHPLVVSYEAAYVPVRDLYMEIDDLLFGPFRRKSVSTEGEG